MKLSDVKTELLSFFLENDSISPDLFEKIKLPKEFEEQKDEIIRKVLDGLEESNFLKKISKSGGSQDDDRWFLESSLEAHGQQIYMSLPLLSAISETINTFIKANKLNERESNPLNISERDIAALLGIINELLESADGNNNEE